MPGQVQGFRLSPQQRRTWRQQADSRAFRAQCAVELDGPLDVERLRQALLAATARHEILRTTFRRSPGIRFPIQVVAAAAAPLWQQAELPDGGPTDALAAAAALLRQAAARPFDLERGPLVHAWLAALAADRHLLVLALPALCADRASLANLVAEIAAGYAAGGTRAAGGAAPVDAGGAAVRKEVGAGGPGSRETGAQAGAGEAASQVVAMETGADEEPVQYVQFSEWQHELLAGEESRGGREFWRAAARPGIASLRLPLEGRGGAGGFAPERLPIGLPADALRRVAAMADECGASPGQVLLAAWQALLWRLTSEPDGGTGVLLAGRPHGELAGAVGPFARFLPLPWRMPARGSFRELVASTRQAWDEAADWQECLGDEEQAAGGAAACFELAEGLAAHRAGEVAFNPLSATAYGERFKVCLTVSRGGAESRPGDGGSGGGEELAAELHYDSRLLAAAAAAALGERYGLMLDALLGGGAGRRVAAGTVGRAGEHVPESAPGPAIDEVELLTPDERRRLLIDFNSPPAGNSASAGAAGALASLRSDRANAPPPAHRLIAAQAARAPSAPAVERGELRLSCGELDGRANQLAHYLAAAGIGSDALVGIAVERSFEMVVGILGILKAGAAYLPLDATYPPERLAFMLTDARVALLLTQQSQVEALPAQSLPGLPVLCLDSEWQRVAGFPATDPAVETRPENLAYVIYTSGSTGRPKGVMVPHGALANYLAWAVPAYGLGGDAPAGDSDGGGEARRGAPVHSPLGFDLTVTSLLAPLAAGASVSLISEELGVGPLAAALRGGAFRVLKVTPAHLGLLQQALAGADLAGRVGTLVAGGEALPVEAAAAWQRLAPATRVVNEYGPTEATVGCCAQILPAADGTGDAATAASGTVPIGRPIADTRLYLLDGGLRPVPAGVPGEIHIGGAGLARGYLGRPDLTAERFVPDPFAGGPAARPGERLYRTGDLGRFLAGGDLEFLGRNDHQVKVRGFRVELGEIEAVLAQHPQVREAAVLAREDSPGETRLAAYLVAGGEPAPNVDELRRFLAAKLPEYMVPAAFVPLPALPLTANGKLDRAALPAPGSRRPDLEKAYLAPRNPVEESLAEIWSEVLGLDRVGVLDSFFALGGDSIRSVRAVALANERGLGVSVEQLFRRQTIDALAADLAAGVASGAAAGAGTAIGAPAASGSASAAASGSGTAATAGSGSAPAAGSSSAATAGAPAAAGSRPGAGPSPDTGTVAGAPPGMPPAEQEAGDEALSRLVSELEKLSEEEVRERLREQAAAGVEEPR